MLELLSLSICIACLSCLCCVYTAAVVSVPRLINLQTDSLLCGRCQSIKTKRKSEETLSSDTKKIVSSHKSVSSEGTESEECPCAIAYVLDPILLSRKASVACTGDERTRKCCKCPSFLDLVGDSSKSPAKVLPRK